jgi:large subunit ribosomal protein L13
MKNYKFKTYSPKKEDIKQDWFLVDAKNKTLGRLATKIADLLRGKNKPGYSQHLDCGSFIVVINAAEIKLTGNKMKDKEYHHHTRYPAGLRTVTPAELLKKAPEKILKNAVSGMIPQNKLKKDILKKLKIFSGTEHNHAAQNPKSIEL